MLMWKMHIGRPLDNYGEASLAYMKSSQANERPCLKQKVKKIWDVAL